METLRILADHVVGHNAQLLGNSWADVITAVSRVSGEEELLAILRSQSQSQEQGRFGFSALKKLGSANDTGSPSAPPLAESPSKSSGGLMGFFVPPKKPPVPESSSQWMSTLSPSSIPSIGAKPFAISEAFPSEAIKALFAAGAALPDDALLDFLSALVKVAMEELLPGANVNGPRTFLLQRIVEVAMANMGRSRLVWMRVWGKVGDVMVAAARSGDAKVSNLLASFYPSNYISTHIVHTEAL